MIASFDIGEVNFAYCIGTVNEIKILKFHNIKKKKTQTVLESCDIISSILLKEDFTICDKVIIEQQIVKNIRAQRIAQHIWTWFKIKFPELNPEFVSARIKTIRSLTYKQRKQYAVDYFKKILIERGDKVNLEYLTSLPKQDDVADCYIQLCEYSKRI